MKKTLLITSLLTSVLAVAGTTGSVEFNNNIKSTVTNFKKDGVKNAITGSEFDTGLKGNVKINDLFAAGFELGNKTSFNNFKVNKDTLFDHSEPSVWVKGMMGESYLKATLKPHKIYIDTKGTQDDKGVTREGYLPADKALYQAKTLKYVLRPELELNLQKSLDDLTFRTNVKSEFNVISKDVKGEVISPVLKKSEDKNLNMIDTNRTVDENKKPTYVDPTLKFDFSASKGNLSGVKGATADVVLNLKGEDLGFANTGLTLSGNYDLDKNTNIAVEAKVNYKKQDAKSITTKQNDVKAAGEEAYLKAKSIYDGQDSEHQGKLEAYEKYMNLVQTENIDPNKDKEKNKYDYKVNSDETNIDAYNKFIELTQTEDGKYAKEYKEQVDKSVEDLLYGANTVYLDTAESGLDENLDFGVVNDSYKLSATYKFGDHLSLGSSAYLYHAYNSENENAIDAVLGAKLDANVDKFSFGASVKGGLLAHLGHATTGAIKVDVNSGYKFNLAEGLTLTPSIEGELLASRIIGETSSAPAKKDGETSSAPAKEDTKAIPTYTGDRRISTSVTPKISLEYMKNGFVFGIGIESTYNFKSVLDQDAYFAEAKAKAKAKDPNAKDTAVPVKYSELKDKNTTFKFVNNVFKAGLTLGYNW